MRRTIAIALALCAAVWAREKKLPSGDAANETVDAAVTALDSDELKQIFGTDFDNGYEVIEVTLTPKGGKPLDVHLDDFLLRSEQTGEHSGPLAASQIAGQGTLVVHRTQQKGSGTSWGGFGGIMMGGGIGGGGGSVEGASAEIKNSEKKDPMLDVLKRKILAEKAIAEPVTGLLFFPMEKEKTKNLVFIYTTPQGKLRTRFR
ncbi:MAG TPA: hypothetical protein VHB50_17250 [Bryobacteraceae bacterium]|nr:hypothetical protein [Bryobacteraceae bacterium]